jgi:hypothetical protein
MKRAAMDASLEPSAKYRPDMERSKEYFGYWTPAISIGLVAIMAFGFLV